jgi:hypothetical protein
MDSKNIIPEGQLQDSRPGEEWAKEISVKLAFVKRSGKATLRDNY